MLFTFLTDLLAQQPDASNASAESQSSVGEPNSSEQIPRKRRRARRRRKTFSKQVSDAVNLSGSARLSEFERDKSYRSDRYYSVGSMWLNARPKKLLGVRTYFDWRLQAPDLTRDPFSDGDLREAYGEVSIEFLDLRVGKQITVWGRADKVNPTDVWSLRNFRLLTTDDEDQRTGLLSVNATANLSDTFRIIAIWQPDWRDAMLPIPPLDGINVKPATPENTADQWGIKIDQSGGDVDWSLSYSRVIDKVPDLRLSGLSYSAAGQLLVDLDLYHQHIDVYGADIAFVAGDLGVRSELAYTKTKDTDGTDSYTKNSNLFGVFGVDRTFDGILTIGVQYLYKQIFDYQSLDKVSNTLVRSAADQVNWISNQQAEQMHGATFRISQKAFNDTLESELAVVTWFYKYDSVIRPKITYAFSDTWKGMIGGDFNMGPEASFFGRLKRLNTAFAEVRYLF